MEWNQIETRSMVSNDANRKTRGKNNNYTAIAARRVWKPEGREEKYSFGVNLYFDDQINSNLHTYKYFILMSIIRDVQDEMEKIMRIIIIITTILSSFDGRKIMRRINIRLILRRRNIIWYQSFFFSMYESMEDMFYEDPFCFFFFLRFDVSIESY